MPSGQEKSLSRGHSSVKQVLIYFIGFLVEGNTPVPDRADSGGEGTVGGPGEIDQAFVHGVVATYAF